MKKGKSIIKKYCFEIILIAILIITSIFIFYIGQKDESFKEIHYDKFVEILFGNSIGLITIWISAYFILIQLYKNTYPMEIIESRFLKKVKILLIFSSIVMLIGALVLLEFDNFVSEIYYISLFVINICLIFYGTYNINREFKLNTYIDKYLEDLTKKLKETSITEKEVNKNFDELRNFFNECIVKDEYYICNNISKKIGKLFAELIENYSKLVIEDKETMADYIFEEIIRFGIYQIDASKNSKSEELINSLFKQQAKNIILCSKINNFDWFKEYCSEINKLLKDFPNSDKYDIVENLYYMNLRIGMYLLKEKEDNWIEAFLEELYILNISLKYAFKNTNINYFARLLSNLISADIEYNECKKYSLLKEYLSKFTIDLTHINDNIQDAVIYYSSYGGLIYEKGDLEKVKDFIDIIVNDKNRIVSDEKWNEYIFFYLNITLEKWEEELAITNRRLIIDLVLELSLKKPDTNYYSMLPKYDEIIVKNKLKSELINEIIDELEELIIRLIINNNVDMFFLMLRMLKRTLVKLEKSDKIVQKKLFMIYINCLAKSINIDEKKYFEISIGYIDECIDELDKEKTISNDLGNTIIEEISEIAMYRRVKNDELIAIIALLSGFLDKESKYHFMNSGDRKKLLYRKLYNIGVNSVENDCEDAVRQVSNSLGWFIIWSINNDTNDLTHYLIDRTIDLFKISKNLEISEKTTIFMMTLFTTVGTYCCRKPEYKTKAFLDQIVSFLKTIDYSNIKTAIELRTKENDMWDKLFEKDTENLTRKFLTELNKGGKTKN